MSRNQHIDNNGMASIFGKKQVTDKTAVDGQTGIFILEAKIAEKLGFRKYDTSRSGLRFIVSELDKQQKCLRTVGAFSKREHVQLFLTGVLEGLS